MRYTRRPRRPDAHPTADRAYADGLPRGRGESGKLLLWAWVVWEVRRGGSGESGNLALLLSSASLSLISALSARLSANSLPVPRPSIGALLLLCRAADPLI